MLLLSIQSILALPLWLAQGWVWIWWSDDSRHRRLPILVASGLWSTMILMPFVIGVAGQNTALSPLTVAGPLTALVIIAAVYFISYDVGCTLLRSRVPRGSLVD